MNNRYYQLNKQKANTLMSGAFSVIPFRNILFSRNYLKKYLSLNRQ